MDEPTAVASDGPYYDDLHQNLVFARPSAITLDSGLTAAYQAIVGDSLPLTLNQPLCKAVTGSSQLLSNPCLVFSLSIGASTVATKRVIANLFYRNMVLHKQIFLGQTLETTTNVAGLADASPKPDSPHRGKALLSIRTTVDGTRALDYQRCALLPYRGNSELGHNDPIGTSDTEVAIDNFLGAVPADWNLEALGPHDNWNPGDARHDHLRDVVDNATSLVRLTQNVAAVHRDAAATNFGQRLVYGGHTVALAQASLARVLGGLATVVGWQSCNHLAPVFEQDILSCRHTLIDQRKTAVGTVRAVRVEVTANRTTQNNDRIESQVLDWTVIVLTT